MSKVELMPKAALKQCEECGKWFAPKRHMKTSKTCSPRCRQALWRSLRAKQIDNTRKVQMNTYGSYYVLIPYELMIAAGIKKGDTLEWSVTGDTLTLIKKQE